MYRPRNLPALDERRGRRIFKPQISQITQIKKNGLAFRQVTLWGKGRLVSCHLLREELLHEVVDRMSYAAKPSRAATANPFPNL
jgi:hypothetical protein